jgi:hypothetical protein
MAIDLKKMRNKLDKLEGKGTNTICVLEAPRWRSDNSDPPDARWRPLP